MIKKIKFNFDATGVGSLPFTDSKRACDIVFEHFSRIPFWPQLPKRSYLENMYVQYSESMPGIVLDEKSRTMHVDMSKAASGIEEAYGRYADEDVEFFRISEGRAKGFYGFLDALKRKSPRVKCVKGQITGPISYALTVTDEKKRPLIYEKDLFEIVTKVLAMKARWQIRRLKEYHENVIIFIDEPYLVSIGSSFVNVNIAEAVRMLDEVIDSIRKDGAVVGVHCCGNTDWSLLLKRKIDILSFDAYTFMKEFFLYAQEIKEFLKRGGTLAWGIVPTSDAADREDEESLVDRLKKGIQTLLDKGIDKKSLHSLITPSCGLGSLEESRAKKILAMTTALEEALG